MAISAAVYQEIEEGLNNKKLRMNSAYLYDMRSLFLEYFELPKYLITSFHLDHGINLPEPNRELEKYFYENNAAVFVTNTEMMEAYRKVTKKPVHAIGALFPRYRKMNNIVPKADRKGTVAFPIHSIFGVDIENGWEEYAHSLLALPKEFHPIKVCVYWLDVARNRHKVFEDLGIEVFTAGYFTNSTFIKRFYDILSNAKYATSNEFGSYLPYSVEMGIPFFMYGERAQLNNTNPKLTKFPQGKFIFTEEFGFKWYDYVRKLHEFSPDTAATITDEQIAFANRLLGLDFEVDKDLIRKTVYQSQLPHLPKFAKDLVHKSIWDVIHLLPESVNQAALKHIKPYYKIQK
ncbi:MAG: hypothetical protein AAGG68_21890 [Bacteroidota bacterium]